MIDTAIIAIISAGIVLTTSLITVVVWLVRLEQQAKTTQERQSEMEARLKLIEAHKSDLDTRLRINEQYIETIGERLDDLKTTTKEGFGRIDSSYQRIEAKLDRLYEKK